MINLSEGLNFEQYLSKATEEQREAQEAAYSKTQLSQDIIHQVKDIQEAVNVVVYSEGYCPDCIVTLPFIRRMGEINPNIKVRILPLKGNEEQLKEFVGTARIPTVLTFNSTMEPKGAYVEVPKELSKKMIKLNGDEQKELIKDYRSGKYNELIEKELMDIIK